MEQQMEQKELEKIGIKITPLKIIIVLLLIFSLSAVSLVLIKNNSAQISGKITNNIQSEGIIPEADAGNIISVSEDEINSSLFTPTSQITRKYCNQNNCIMQIGAFNYMQDENRTWKEFTEVVKFSHQGYDFKMNWYDKQVIIEIGVVTQDNKNYSVSEIKTLFPQIDFSKYITNNNRNYKYGLNFSNIPSNLKSQAKYIYLTLKSSDNLTWDDVVLDKDNKRIVIQNISFDYSDIQKQGYTLQLYDRRTVLIGNLSGKNEFFIDPSVTETILPLSDYSIQWSDAAAGDNDGVNWEHVVDASDLTYLTSAPDSTARIDLYNMANVVGIDDNDIIISVKVRVKARNPNPKTGNGGVYCMIRENSVTTSGTLQSIGSTFAYYTQTWTKRPSNSVNWTLTDLNALIVGMKDKSHTIGIDYVSEVDVIINYTVVAIPTVETHAASSITSTSVALNGHITDTGGTNCFSRGFYMWIGATCGGPGGPDYTLNENGDFGIGIYSLPKTGLAPSTQYSYAARATNGIWDTGLCVQFTTLSDECTCPAINTNWVISTQECTLSTTCNLGTGKLQVIDNGYLKILTGGKMLANKCYFENSSSRYRVWKQTGGILKCGS